MQLQTGLQRNEVMRPPALQGFCLVHHALLHARLAVAHLLDTQSKWGPLALVAPGLMADGMLTDRDLVTALVALDLNIHRLCVADAMSTERVTARENESLIDLMRSMRHEGVRRLPVVGPQHELLGVVTMDDVMDVLAGELSLLAGTIQGGEQNERQ